jgi:glutamine amidotransferase
MFIGILDYGMANLRSVQKALERTGHAAHIISQGEQIDACDRLILPGVGAIADAILALRRGGLDEAIRRHIDRGRPFLGICLGLQMLVDVGYEDGEHRALGIIPGRCIRFDVDRTLGLKVPHMGWNTLEMRGQCPLYRGLPSGSSVYFVHSYHVVPEDPAVIATTTDYGRPFVSSIWRGNVMATQFHPEKSQKVGLQILANFAAASL